MRFEVPELADLGALANQTRPHSGARAGSHSALSNANSRARQGGLGRTATASFSEGRYISMNDISGYVSFVAGHTVEGIRV